MASQKATWRTQKENIVETNIPYNDDLQIKQRCVVIVVGIVGQGSNFLPVSEKTDSLRLTCNVKYFSVTALTGVLKDDLQYV